MNQITEFLSSTSDPGATQRAASAKDDYVRVLNALYAQIKDWLKESIDANLVTGISAGEIQITEQLTGAYLAPEISFNAAATNIRLTPKGFFIIGANGRVDAHSNKGRHAMLIYVNNEWHLVNPTTGKTRSKLTESTFLDLLKYLVGS